MQFYEHTATTHPYFISLGRGCIVKQILRQNRLQPQEKLPFDFISTDHQFVIHALQTNFAGWDNTDNFYVPYVSKNIMGKLVPQLRIQGFENSHFFHEIEIDDCVASEEIREYFTTQGIDEGDYYPEVPLTVHPEAMERFVAGNVARIAFLRAIIDQCGKLQDSHKPGIVFVRNESQKNTATAEQYAEELFATLQQYCGDVPFVLLYVQDTKVPVESVELSRPRVLFEKDGSVCLSVQNEFHQSDKDALRILLKNILAPDIVSRHV